MAEKNKFRIEGAGGSVGFTAPEMRRMLTAIGVDLARKRRESGLNEVELDIDTKISGLRILNPELK